MKNIVITWLHSKNYGTNLQAYALQKFLNTQGYSTDVLNYKPKYECKENKIRSLGDFFDFIKLKYDHIIMRLIHIKYKKQFVDKDEEFYKFVEENISITEKYEKSNLSDLNNIYDNFIVGSDQIWSPKYIDSVFFLDFVGYDKNKISYAPSLASKSFSDEWKSMVNTYISRFDYLSVREQEGKDILESITSKDVKITLDPTLLLTREEWTKLTNCNEKEKYILCYFLGNKKYYWRYVHRIEKETGYKVKIIPIKKEAYFKRGEKELGVGPKEFLELFSSASVICTDSFHGAVFSIIFNKNFSVMKRFDDSDKKSENSRIYNLLRKFKLEQFLISEKFTKLEYEVKNYNDVNKLLEDERKKSINYIIKAINRG